MLAASLFSSAMDWKIVLGAVAALALYSLYQSDLWGPLRRVPGAPLARVTRFWELWALHNGKDTYTTVLRRTHHAYGPVVRLAPGRYSIADPDEAKKIYDNSDFAKSDYYQVFSPEVRNHDIFTDQNVKRNAANRRKVAGLYALSTVKSYEPYIDDMSVEFCNRLRGLSQDGEPVCVPAWLRYYAFDVIGKITFSHDFGMTRAGRDPIGILAAVNANGSYGTTVGIIAPAWHKFVAPILGILMVSVGGAKANTWIMEKVSESAKISEGCYQGKDVPRDFNQKTLDLIKEGNLDDEQRFYTIRNNIGAGSDTTSSTLGAIVWYLAQDKSKLQALRDEIKSGIQGGRLSDPVTFAEAQSMPYLQAVIKESIRLHPAVGAVLPRVVPAGGTTLCGWYFPAGTVVGANPWVLNYDQNAFGSDADSFRSERWLEDDLRAKKMESALFSFGAGARTCIGKNVAILELSKLVPQLYRQFDFEVTSERTISCGFIVSHKFDARIKVLD